MVPGLWLEPEVIGVRSADGGAPARRARSCSGTASASSSIIATTSTCGIPRPSLISTRSSIGWSPSSASGSSSSTTTSTRAPGTDLDADSVGDGLLAHNRAHLAWLDGVLDRHPDLVIENCTSGAMRMDFAMLSRLAMQSTSDQQDFRKYPPIAASAPLSMLPEQAASWAYPQPEMTDEEVAFCLVTGLLGRFYVSGHLNHMDDARRALVAEAVRRGQAAAPVPRRPRTRTGRSGSRNGRRLGGARPARRDRRSRVGLAPRRLDADGAVVPAPDRSRRHRHDRVPRTPSRLADRMGCRDREP